MGKNVVVHLSRRINRRGVLGDYVEACARDDDPAVDPAPGQIDRTVDALCYAVATDLMVTARTAYRDRAGRILSTDPGLNSPDPCLVAEQRLQAAGVLPHELDALYRLAGEKLELPHLRSQTAAIFRGNAS